ncbi:hypothetical protein TorRG33x02_317370, partial [Trema orientale]
SLYKRHHRKTAYRDMHIKESKKQLSSHMGNRMELAENAAKEKGERKRKRKKKKRKRWQCKDKTLGNGQPLHYSLMRACLLSPCLSSNEVINEKQLCLCVCLYLIVQNISKLNVYHIHFFFHIATT